MSFIPLPVFPKVMPLRFEQSLDLSLGIILAFVTFRSGSKKRTVEMALDTGATYTMVSPDTIHYLGLDPHPTGNRIEIVSASGVEYVPLVKIQTVTAFGMNVKDLHVVVHTLPPESSVDGLLGLDFMKYFNIQLDFLNKSIIFSKK